MNTNDTPLHKKGKARNKQNIPSAKSHFDCKLFLKVDWLSTDVVVKVSWFQDQIQPKTSSTLEIKNAKPAELYKCGIWNTFIGINKICIKKEKKGKIRY